MHRQLNILVLILFALVAISSVCEASTIQSKSCSSSDVQAAIDAANSGDTVKVPAGSSNWTSSVSIPDDKKITLMGAGIGSTIIRSASTAIRLNGSGSRLTGFELIFSSTADGVTVYGSGWRIDHCKLQYTGGKGAAIRADGRNRYYPQWTLNGLVDNCVINNGRILPTAGAVPGASDPTKSFAVMSQPADLGGKSAVYIEDCTFNIDVFGNIVDANYGGAYVFRYNHVVKGNTSGFAVEAHSLKSSSRGTRKWEIYGNLFTGVGGAYSPFLLRGGIGRIFDNRLEGEWQNENIRIDNQRSTEALGPGLCNGSTDWDQNVPGQNGWLCRDQIGAGPDSSNWTSSAPYPTQPRMPMYAWNNKSSNHSTMPVVVSSGSDVHIKKDRDFYDFVSSGFDGSTGVGSGPWANRPQSCKKGVAYWATDRGGNWNTTNGSENDGALYVADGNNNFVLDYVPYPYPHPLRGGNAEPSKLAPPSNFRIVK